MTDENFQEVLKEKREKYEEILLPEGVEKIMALEAEAHALEDELMRDIPSSPFSHAKAKERAELHKKYANLTWKVFCEYKRK